MRTGFFSPYALSVSPDGRRLYIVHANSDNVMAYNIENPNPAPVAPVSAYRAGSTPVAIAISPGGRSAWVANSASATVTRIDLTTNGLTTIPVPAEPLALAVRADGSRVYVTHGGRSQITTIDAARPTRRPLRGRSHGPAMRVAIRRQSSRLM